MHYVHNKSDIHNKIPHRTESAGNFISSYITNITATYKADQLANFFNLRSKKLASLNTAILIDNTISTESFKMLQQADVLYITILATLGKKQEAGKYKTISGLLYKELQTSTDTKFLLCMPSLILPNVVHILHKQLNHPSIRKEKLNFRKYFYHPLSSTLIQGLNTSCPTCHISTNLKPTDNNILTNQAYSSLPFKINEIVPPTIDRPILQPEQIKPQLVPPKPPPIPPKPPPIPPEPPPIPPELTPAPLKSILTQNKRYDHKLKIR